MTATDALAHLDLDGAHPTVRAFLTAATSHDFEAVRDLLADDCTFTSPVVFKPYEGKDLAAGLLLAAGLVFGDTLAYDRVLVDGRGAACMFHATVGDRSVQGTDFLTLDDEGRIVDFLVMLRPMSGLHAMAEAMQAKLTELGAI